MYPWGESLGLCCSCHAMVTFQLCPSFSLNTDVFSLMEDYDSFCFTAAGKASKSSEKEAPTLLKIVQPLKAITRHGTV